MVYKKEIISLLIIILISVSIYSCDEKFKPVKTSLDTENIPDYERIIMMIGVGKYLEEFEVAESIKKEAEEILVSEIMK